MFPAIGSIVFLLSLSTVVTSNIVRVNRSPITFPIARRVNLTGIYNLVQHDQTRAKLLRTQGVAKASGGLRVDAAVINSPATNLAVDYVASIGIGIPPTFCKSQLSSPLNFLSSVLRFAYRGYWKVCLSAAKLFKYSE